MANEMNIRSWGMMQYTCIAKELSKLRSSWPEFYKVNCTFLPKGFDWQMENNYVC